MNYIDLFAGAGGLSEGFIRAGFKPIAHVEMDEAACFTLKTRTVYHHLKETGKPEIYDSYLKGEINRQELYNKIPNELLDSIINLPIGYENNAKIYRKINSYLEGKEVDLIIGGPPCQAYSLVGRARSQTKMVGDHRNYLYVAYAKFLERYKPKMFVFENVLGLISAGNGNYMKNLKNLFSKKGYDIEPFTLNAKDFGVLQNRKRIIIIGWVKDFVPNLIDFEGIKTNTEYTVRNVLDDLPHIQAGEGNDKCQKYFGIANKYLIKNELRNGLEYVTQHIARPHTAQDKEIYRIAVRKWNDKRKRLSYTDLPIFLKTHHNQHSFFDRFKVVANELPFSQTVVAHISKDGHYYIHPDIDQNRSLTIREAARLQSFPDNYYFEGVKEGANRTAAFKQIGNAVPILLAESIAREMKKSI